MYQFQGKTVSHCIRWKTLFLGNVEVEFGKGKVAGVWISDKVETFCGWNFDTRGTPGFTDPDLVESEFVKPSISAKLEIWDVDFLGILI